jgi:hypothetical protein
VPFRFCPAKEKRDSNDAICMPMSLVFDSAVVVKNGMALLWPSSETKIFDFRSERVLRERD